MQTQNIAVFADFENVAIGAKDAKFDTFKIEVVLQRLLDKGSVIIKRAYADWTRYSSSRKPLHEHGFELIEVPHVSYGGKNSADIKLVVDAIDLCHTKPHVQVFAIISGDSDFSPLVAKLRENGRFVIGVGVRESTSGLLVESCDEFIFYDDLVAKKRRTRKARAKKPAADSKGNEALDLVVDAAEALLRDKGEAVWGSHVKQVIKRKRPDFDETAFGYRGWGDLLEDAARKGRLEVTRDSASGGYRVTAVADA